MLDTGPFAPALPSPSCCPMVPFPKQCPSMGHGFPAGWRCPGIRQYQYRPEHPESHPSSGTINSSHKDAQGELAEICTVQINNETTNVITVINLIILTDLKLCSNCKIAVAVLQFFTVINPMACCRENRLSITYRRRKISPPIHIQTAAHRG